MPPMQRLEPNSTALLVVDVQERLAPAMEPAAFERLERGIDLLLSAASLLHVPTLATEQYPRGLGATIETMRKELDALGAPRVEKTTFCATEPVEVLGWLADKRPRAIVVVGIEAHVCVYQTVRDLVGRGYDVHVPHDAVASRRDDDKRVALDLMSKAGATITTAETVVFDLLRRAEGDVFKALSKKMK